MIHSSKTDEQRKIDLNNIITKSNERLNIIQAIDKFRLELDNINNKIIMLESKIGDFNNDIFTQKLSGYVELDSITNVLKDIEDNLNLLSSTTPRNFGNVAAEIDKIKNENEDLKKMIVELKEAQAQPRDIKKIPEIKIPETKEQYKAPVSKTKINLSLKK